MPFTTSVGPGLRILHIAGGIVVNPQTKIGSDCTLVDSITIGGSRGAHAKIGDRVRLGAGTRVIGGVTIGDDVLVGAGAVVVTDLPSGCRAAGVPAKPIRVVSEPSPPHSVEAN